MLAVVLNYDNVVYTEECVRSLLDQQVAGLRVVVVDNGSKQGTADELRRRLGGEVDVLALERNQGIPGALNHGLLLGMSGAHRAVLVMMNDTALEPGGVAALLATLDRHPQVGAVSPLQVRYDEPDIVVSAGSRLRRLAWLTATVSAGRARDEVVGDGVVLADYLDFTCILIRADALVRVGLPDPRFRFYWEDVDWGVRCRRGGWRLAVDPAAVVRHRMGGTLGGTRGTTGDYYQQRNRLLSKRTLDGRWGIARLVALEPAVLLARALTRGTDGGGLLTQWRALRDFVLGRPYPHL